MYCQPEENRLSAALVFGGGSGAPICALWQLYSAISHEELEQLLGRGEALLHVLTFSWEPCPAHEMFLPTCTDRRGCRPGLSCPPGSGHSGAKLCVGVEVPGLFLLGSQNWGRAAAERDFNWQQQESLQMLKTRLFFYFFLFFLGTGRADVCLAQ